jgi:hypothetical protein
MALWNPETLLSGFERVARRNVFAAIAGFRYVAPVGKIAA